MHRIEEVFKGNIRSTNRKVLTQFLSILMLVDFLYYLLNLGDFHISGYEDPETYFKLVPLNLAIGGILLLLNWKGPKAFIPYLGYPFVLYVTLSRLLYLENFQFSGLAIVPYVGFYMLISAIFYYRFELVFSTLVSQTALFFILYHNGIDLYEIGSTMLVSTFLVALSCYLGFDHFSKQKRIYESEYGHNESKRLLNGILSNIDSLVILVDLEGNIKFINAAFEKITGFKIEEENYKNMDQYFDTPGLKKIINCFKKVAASKQFCIIENHRITGSDGKVIDLKIRMDYIDLNDYSYVILTANDLSKETHLSKVKDIVIRLNNMLSEYHSLDEYFEDILANLVETIPYAELGSILLADEDGMMTMKSNVGYDQLKAEQFKLHLHESFFYRNCGKNLKKPVIINHLPNYSMEGVTEILDNQNGIVVVSSLSSPIIIDGKFKGLLNLDSSKDEVFNQDDLEIMQFLTEQISLVLTSHQLLDQTIYLSKYDQLTGLFNRWKLNDIEQVTIPHSLRYKEKFEFVMMDLNNLKGVNDRYGHQLGDTYILEFSLLIKKHSRETDILIRIGGDEFVGIYFGIETNDLVTKMDAINHELYETMKTFGISDWKCCFGYGIASFPSESQTVSELMKLSDQRMYEKKVEMKNNG